jgi:predicted ATP-grasp superfamily ATP-dependent carboligase
MVKAVDNRDVHGLPGAGKAVTTCPEDLLEAVDRLSGDGPMPELVLQEHIPNGTVWMFNGYFDGNSECLFGITARKLRTYPAYVGQTSLGICAANEAVADTTRHFMHALGYTGVLDIGYIYDRRDGQHKLLDVNPRIGSTFRLFLAENGLDVARALYLDMTGQAVPRGEAIDQRKWLVENYDLAASIGYWREGDLRFRDWLSSLSGIEESAWLAADDPSPFGAMWAASVRYLLRTSLDRHERLGWLKMNGAPTL